jgi:tRNA threonylcarbamoyladenosine biosynthesis protein TsaE
LASDLAAYLRGGSVVCLTGDLGAGKTTFVAGLARALGCAEAVSSPTFTLENRYPVRRGERNVVELVHLDLYRPGDTVERDLIESVLEARGAGAVIAIEWGDPIREWLIPFLHLRITAPVEVAAEDVPRQLELLPVPAGWKHLAALTERWCATEASA